jgi:catechol 2,3-dioxygenase-like lactoylglutathione lyase family enzyme
VTATLRHHHTALHVSDVERSLQFYANGLGMSVVDRWQSGAYIAELFARPGVDVFATLLTTSDHSFMLELVDAKPKLPPVDPSGAAPGTAHLAFGVPDVESLYDRMTRLGFSALSRPVVPDAGPNAGGMLVYLLDPDGNRVELIQE